MWQTLILEDHNETRHFFAKLVQEIFPNSLISYSENLQQARYTIMAQKFSLAIIDLSLPDGNGLEIVQQLRSNQPHCFVIVATIYDDESHVLNSLKAGAMGYLLKDSPRPFLLEALRGIPAGLPPVSGSVTRQMMRAFIDQRNLQRRHTDIRKTNTSSQSAVFNAKINSQCKQDIKDGTVLTNREKEVLRLMAKGFNRTEISNYLEITSNTSACHIKNIYRKLCIGSRAEAALLAQKMGIV